MHGLYREADITDNNAGIDLAKIDSIFDDRLTSNDYSAKTPSSE